MTAKGAKEIPGGAANAVVAVKEVLIGQDTAKHEFDINAACHGATNVVQTIAYFKNDVGVLIVMEFLGLELGKYVASEPTPLFLRLPRSSHPPPPPPPTPTPLRPSHPPTHHVRPSVPLLSRYLEKKGEDITNEQLWSLATGLVEGTRQMHAVNVLHRDVSF